MRLILLTALILLLTVSTHTLAESVSVKLKDTIKQGSGTIDVFRAQTQNKNPTAAELEAFRVNNGGKLVFAVDVNEAANGTEKASSQGVAVESASITVVSGGITTTFSDFSTPTRSMLAKTGTTERTGYYTIIGETGSSRVTPNANSDVNGSSFDEVLIITVGQDLSSATAVTLNVTLLDTNISLGDPEAFYDFSGGFEDVALISDEDNSVLTGLGAGQAEAPLVITQGQVLNPIDAWVYYPSSTEYFLAAYEDLYPVKGDYDFNDLVIGYRVGFGMNNDQVTSMLIYGYIIARGSSYNHDWYLHLAYPDGTSGSGTLNLFKPGSTEQEEGYPIAITQLNDFDQKILISSKTLMTQVGSEMVNTLTDKALVQGHKFSISMDYDALIDVSQLDTAPYDPYLYVKNSGYEIHLPNKPARLGISVNNSETGSGFKDSSGYPFVIIIPDDWEPPLENTDLGEAYIDFLNHVASSDNTFSSWYLAPQGSKVKGIGRGHWKW
ncbi:LruC domain-containing protein [Photobacterium indicum]|uniref:LruC domain-containing protein n=1 Tax=Photobacterium indicum TaxID=81447 RepID=UPI003D0D6CCE